MPAGRNRMYDEFAHLWTLISAPEEYAEEASHWREALRAKLGPGRHEILELGVGGGNNLSHLTRDFQATAVDISPKMLENSTRLNPGVEHHVGDMRSVRLGRSFDAVLIHDAVAYMLTEADLEATFNTARAHLRTGGVFVTAPDWFSETFTGTTVSHATRSDGDTELTYVEYDYDPDPSDTTIETVFLYFIRQRGGLRIEEDRHTTGLFPIATWVGLMEKVGFDVEKLPYPVHDDGHDAYLLAGTVP
ncbi:MAG: class I SAM-dependent methyltransferase [Dehalococcoidia bacterium]